MKDIDADYYGYRDEDDGVIAPLEQEVEKKGINHSKESPIPGWDFSSNYCNHHSRIAAVCLLYFLEIFARTLFLRNFAYAKFLENKTLLKWQNHSVVY